jgi:parvulin-like peptidyl-prolyl isomerase
VVVGVWCSAAALADPTLRNRLVAIVNDSIITYQELNDFTGQAVDVLRRTFPGQSTQYQERYAEAIKNGLEQLINRQLILDDFKNAGGTLPENIIDDEIRDRIRRQYGDRATLTQTLQKRGVTFESFRQQAREEIIISFMRGRNVSANVVISPAKIEHYYSNRLDQFKVEDQVKLRMIVLNCPTQARSLEVARMAVEIQTKIREGTSFAEMASVYSEGSSQGEGGDWGWRERTKLNAGLSEVAFGLKAGQLSAVLALAREANDDYWIYQYDKGGRVERARKYTSRDKFIEEKSLAGDPAEIEALPQPREYYLMLVEAKREAHTRPLDEMREEIEKELTMQERARLEKKWLDRLKDKSFVVQFSSF